MVSARRLFTRVTRFSRPSPLRTNVAPDGLSTHGGQTVTFASPDLRCSLRICIDAPRGQPESMLATSSTRTLPTALPLNASAWLPQTIGCSQQAIGGSGLSGVTESAFFGRTATGTIKGTVGHVAPGQPADDVPQDLERMAEGEGFEPPRGLRPGGFQAHC